MAWVRRVPSGRWKGTYRLADGVTKRSKTFDHERAATRWATAQEQAVAEGSTRDPARGRMKWGAWRPTWWDARSTEGSTRRSDASKVRMHLAPRWDEVPLNAITTTDVQGWVTLLQRPKSDRGAGLSASSVRGCFHLLSGSLRAAVHEGLLETNPCTPVRLPTLPSEPERYLTDHETEKLLEALGQPYRMLAELLLETGMRIGEAVCLHRHRLDFTAKRISVAESWERDEHVVRPHTKGGHTRSVPMSEHLETALATWLAGREQRATCGFTHAPGSVCRSELVLVGPAGGVIDPGNFSSRVFPAALGKAELGHARVHDLRHTWASRLVTAGVPIQRVQKWAGHGSLTPTQRYARLMDEGDEVYRSALRGRREAREAEQEAERLSTASNAHQLHDPSAPPEAP